MSTEPSKADYAWNLLVEPEFLDTLAARGMGKLVSVFGGSVERILMNFTTPDPALGDKASEWTEEDPNPHPFLTDPAVLRILYQTSNSPARQKTQALVREWWSQIGVATRLNVIDVAVFFGGDPASPDTIP